LFFVFLILQFSESGFYELLLVIFVHLLTVLNKLSTAIIDDIIPFGSRGRYNFKDINFPIKSFRVGVKNTHIFFWPYATYTYILIFFKKNSFSCCHGIKFLFFISTQLLDRIWTEFIIESYVANRKIECHIIGYFSLSQFI
jgi:hypothetical protein